MVCEESSLCVPLIRIYQGTDVLERMDMGDTTVGFELGILVVHLVGYQLLLYIILHLKYAARKRE